MQSPYAAYPARNPVGPQSLSLGQVEGLQIERPLDASSSPSATLNREELASNFLSEGLGQHASHRPTLIGTLNQKELAFVQALKAFRVESRLKCRDRHFHPTTVCVRPGIRSRA